MDPSEVAGPSGELERSNNANVQVAVRVRPPSDREWEQGFSHCVSVDAASKSIVLSGRTIPTSKRFCFDHVADEHASQRDIFLAVGKPIADCCLQGYHCCLLAYGQTGAGKTYTMEGPDMGQAPVDVNAMTPGADPRGLVPRILDYMFECMEQEQRLSGVEFTVRCSYLQIYNDQVSDLLDPSAPPLIIREDLHRGIFVDGVHEVTLSGPEKAAALRRTGAANRKVAMTAMNEESSRSHSVFTLMLESQRKDDKGVVQRRTSRFYLVDLAGSERQRQSEAAGQRLKEAGSINRSLSALGNVIKALVDISDGKIRHVPYRDSKLTYLLRDALGGNAKCTLIAAVSPAEKNAEESLSTLKFVERAKLMRNDAVVNEAMMGNPAVMGEEIRRLRLELASLRALTQGSVSIPLSLAPTPAAPAEPENERIRRLEHIISQSTHQSMAAERRAAEELRELREKNAGYDALVQRLEYKVQSTEMMLKLKIAALKAREGEAKGEVQGPEADQVQQLEKELAIQRRLAEFNPDVVRFKMELDSCKARLREAQDALATGGATRASLGGSGSAVNQDAELARLDGLVSALREELAEQHQEAEAARADAVAARKDAQECRENMTIMEEHVRRIAAQAEQYRAEVNTSRKQQQMLQERLREQAQARHLGSVAEARVSELVEQLALKELELSKLSARHEEQARLQVDLLAELEKAVAEKESAAERIRQMQAEGATQKAKMEELGKIEVELLTALEKENSAHELMRSQLVPLQARLAELEAELDARSQEGHLDEGASEKEAQWAAAHVAHEEQRSSLQAQVEQLQEKLALAEQERQGAEREREEALRRALDEQQQRWDAREKAYLEKAAQLGEQARMAQEEVEALKLQLKGHAEGALAVEQSTQARAEEAGVRAKEIQAQLEALQQEMGVAREERARAEAQLQAEKEERERATAKAQEELEGRAEECRSLEASLGELKELLAQATEKARLHEATSASLAAAETAAAEAGARCAAAQAEVEVLQQRAREAEEAAAQAGERAVAAEHALAEALKSSEEQGIRCARQEYEMECLGERIREAQREQAEAEAVARKRAAELEHSQRAQTAAEAEVAAMQAELEGARVAHREIQGMLSGFQLQMDELVKNKSFLKAQHAALQGELREAKDRGAKQEARLREAESQLRAGNEARARAEAAAQEARGATQRLAQDLRSAEAVHSEMQAAYQALLRKADALEVVVVTVSAKACDWEHRFQEAQAQVPAPGSVAGGTDFVPRDRAWASECPVTDSQLDQAVEGLALARSWSLGSRKSRKGVAREGANRPGPQGGAENGRDAEAARARLLFEQLSMVKATAEYRLTKVLPALAVKRAAEKAAKKSPAAEGVAGAQSTEDIPWTLQAMADDTLSSEQTDALESVMLDTSNALEALQKHFMAALATGSGKSEAQHQEHVVDGQETSHKPVTELLTNSVGDSQDASSESGMPRETPGELSPAADPREGVKDSIAGGAVEAEMEGPDAMRRFWSLEQARWALRRGINTTLQVLRELESGEDGAVGALPGPRGNTESSTAPESRGLGAASRGRLEPTGPGLRWTEEEEMQEVALHLLKGVQGVRALVGRMAEAVESLQAQLAEQEEVAAHHGEAVEELTRLKEAAERESQALGAQLQQKQETEASLEALLESLSQERARLDRELQEALEGQRRAESQREKLEGQVGALERERASLEQSEQQCAEQAQVLHQQKMELVSRMREEGKALQCARDEKKLLQRQVEGEAQRNARLKHRLEKAERDAQKLRREVAEKQKDSETLSLLLHNKEEELQKAEAEVKKVQEAMGALEERHEHDRQRQHLQLTLLEEQAEGYKRRLEEQELGRQQQAEEDERGMECSEAGEEEEEEEEEEDEAEAGATDGVASPKLWKGRARRRAQGSQPGKVTRSLWNSVSAAAGALKAVGASPGRPPVPRTAHHSRSSGPEEHRSSGSEEQPPLPLRRMMNQAGIPSAAGTSKTPRNGGAGAGAVPWYQVTGSEAGSGVMTRSKKKKLQMSQQGVLPGSGHEGAPSAETENSHRISQASDGAAAAECSDSRGTAESLGWDDQGQASSRRREVLGPVNRQSANLTPPRDEDHRTSKKQDRDAVHGERGSKTEGKGRNWLGRHP